MSKHPLYRCICCGNHFWKSMMNRRLDLCRECVRTLRREEELEAEAFAAAERAA